MNYKDYQIHAVPYQLADTGQWKIDIQILIDRDSETIFRKFSAGNSFESKDKAIRYCFDFGKEIIDEEDTKCTISNL
ncbi:MAG: HlyU family transcriptional regulator [Proteobacteria bacterium]|nr:HlyU family transcriptional regulator [Pseudomonadota bacterium]